MAAAGSSLYKGLQQYFTPPELAQRIVRTLISYANYPIRLTSFPTAIDPQCGEGGLLRYLSLGRIPGTYEIFHRHACFGFEVDKAAIANLKANNATGIDCVVATCVDAASALDVAVKHTASKYDGTPDTMFDLSVANPPFGLYWKMSDGSRKDSTTWTWEYVTRVSKMGAFVCYAPTADRLKLFSSVPGISIMREDRIKLGDYWPGVKGEASVVYWRAEQVRKPVTSYKMSEALNVARDVLREDARPNSEYNMWLRDDGILRANVSIRSHIERSISQADANRLVMLDKQHPTTLAADVATRRLMQELVASNMFAIEPKAKAAIDAALDAARKAMHPIMPITDFQRLAYCDDLDTILCIKSFTCPLGYVFTAGKKYNIDTNTFTKTSRYTRKAQRYDEAYGVVTIEDRDYELVGQDKEIRVWSAERVVRTAGRGAMAGGFLGCSHFAPCDSSGRPVIANALPDETFFDYFAKPNIKTVAESNAKEVRDNFDMLTAMEAMGGFTYFDGQKEYLARALVPDGVLIAAETGAGKTLAAISSIVCKGARRALVVAPQATTKASICSSDEDDEDDESMLTASQWHSEIEKFAPYMPVRDLCTIDDYERMLQPDGTLPDGIYVTYYEALLTNGAIEECPSTWKDVNKLWNALKVPPPSMTPEENGVALEQIGKQNARGIRCIAKPSLATCVNGAFDWICFDEGHLLANLESKRTKAAIRLQSRFRVVLTATPIKNRVDDIFPVMGWLKVDDWYKGDKCSPLWPYRKEDYGRFVSTYLCSETDIEAKRFLKSQNKAYKPKETPVISSPSRLLRIISPTVAFISKGMCSKTYVKPTISDIRVPMGKQQRALYTHFSNLQNVPGGKTPRVRYGKQISLLRAVCASPAGQVFHSVNESRMPVVTNPYNPKVVAALELVADILSRGEQVIIVNSRHSLTNVLHDVISKAGVPCSRIDSSVNVNDHSTQSQLFKDGKTRVMFMGIKCAQGHSYPACPNLVICSLEYSNGSLEQAIGRNDRLNSVRVPSIYAILCKGSIEERMFDVVATKDDAAKICLRGQRVARDFKPVELTEILAQSILDSSAQSYDVEDEDECIKAVPSIIDRLTNAAHSTMYGSHTATSRHE